MKRHLFICIGNRDLQEVYQLPSGFKRRVRISIDKLQDADNIKVFWPDGITEPREQDKRTDKEADKPQKKEDNQRQSLGICFPIFSKVLAYLNEKRVTEIDRLFILATSRKHVLPALENIKESWEKGDYLERVAGLYDYLVDGILHHAKGDKTSAIAKFLAQRIEAGNMPLKGVKFEDITVLDLGSAEYFSPLINKDPRQINLEDLKRADINTLDFFETELFRSLKPWLGELENSRIFMGSYSGGMPMMQRGLDNVLFSFLNHAEYERIFTSEYLSYQVDRRLQSPTLRVVKKLNDSVIRLAWGPADFLLGKLERSIPLPLPEKNLKAMRQTIDKARKVEYSASKWFERFSGMIFMSLYAMNLNEVIVWLKSLQESALKHLIRQESGTLWQGLNYKQDKVVLLPGDPGRGRWVDLDVQGFLNREYGIDEDRLRTSFAIYINLFLNEDNLSLSQEWDDLNQIRNRLLHNGLAVDTEPNNLNKILSFIGIEFDDLKAAITCLQENDLLGMMRFESKWLANPFFKSVGQIAGFTQNVLPERELCAQYIRSLHA
jgi:hypothetical protein